MSEKVNLLSRYSSDFVFPFCAIVLATWVVMCFAVLLDLWTGVEKAKANGEKLSSHGLRRTVQKIGDYWRVQAFGLMIDIFASLWLNFPIASLLIGFGVLLIEGRSVVENLRAKRSAAAELPTIISQIISAKNTHDAKAILDLLTRKKEELN